MNTIRKTVGFVLAVLLAVSLAPGMVRAADSCQARFVKNEGRVYTYALDVPELKDSYPINTDEAEEDDLEYAWGFRFTDGTQVFEVMTSHFKFGEPETVSLYEMQTNLWKQDPDGGFTVISDWMLEDCTLEIENTTLYWTFTMPEDVDVSSLRITETFAGSYVGSQDKLAPPQNARWETDGEGSGYPGYLYWEPSASDTGDADTDLEYFVEVYNGSERVYMVGWSARGTAEPFRVASFLWEPHESGEYRFSVTLEDWEDETRNSDPVWSDVWTYKNPGVYLSVPYGLQTNGNTLIWKNDSGSDFQDIKWYFSEEENSEESSGGSSWATENNTADLSRVTRSFRCGDGWYHFRVRNLSRDIRAACPSDWSDYLTVQVVNGAVVSGGQPVYTVIDSGTRTDPATRETIRYETRSDGSVAVSGDVSAAAPVLVAAYNENGQMTGVTQLTEPGRADISGGDTARLFWLGENSVPKCGSVPIK